MDGLRKAIRYFKTQAALANALGVNSMAVTQWKNRQVPAGRAVQIERMTNGLVTAKELRPDIFGETDSQVA